MRNIRNYLSPKKQKVSIDQQIEAIVQYIDFDRIHGVMEHLNWRWAPKNTVPSIDEIKETGLMLLQEVAKYEDDRTPKRRKNI